MQEFNKLHVYHINSSSDNGGGVSPGDGALLASDFGDWLDLPSKSNQIFDEQILIQYKLDLMSYPKKAILYLAGQFGLNSAFEGSEITIGVLPLNTRPKHQLKQNFTVQATECYLQIETTGEVKLIAVSGDLPVAIGVSEPDPYFLNVDYNPQIEEDTEPTTYTAERRQFFTRNNCTGGASGTAVEFVKNYSSTISQADADTKASNDPNFNSEGQAFANNPANGATCVMPVEYIATRTESFTRNNCAAGASGTAVNFTKNYTSGISQADADNKAATDPNFAAEGQAFANDPANGAICVLPEEYFASRTENFTRNNCGDGFTGSTVSFTKNYVSGISQADADNKAATDPNFASEGQAFANNPVNGATCTPNAEENYYLYMQVEPDTENNILVARLYDHLGNNILAPVDIQFDWNFNLNGAPQSGTSTIFSGTNYWPVSTYEISSTISDQVTSNPTPSTVSGHTIIAS